MTELVFTLTVTDASGIPSVNDDTNTVTITVTAGPNDPPTANAGPDRKRVDVGCNGDAGRAGQFRSGK